MYLYLALYLNVVILVSVPEKAVKCLYEGVCFNFLGAILLALGVVLRPLKAILGSPGAVLESY